MALKNVRFSFTLPMEAVFAMMQHGSSNVQVEVIGSDMPERKPKRLTGRNGVALLAAPVASPGPRLSAVDLVKKAFVESQNGRVTTKELRALFEANGRVGNSASQSLFVLKERGMCEMLGDGAYQASKPNIEKMKQELGHAPGTR